MWEIAREEQYGLTAQSYSVKSIAFKLAPTLILQRGQTGFAQSLVSFFKKHLLLKFFFNKEYLIFFKKALTSTHFELFYLQLCRAGLFSYFSQEQFLGLAAEPNSCCPERTRDHLLAVHGSCLLDV